MARCFVGSTAVTLLYLKNIYVKENDESTANMQKKASETVITFRKLIIKK